MLLGADTDLILLVRGELKPSFSMLNLPNLDAFFALVN